MKRIILHWTAGGYAPTAHEKECYHFLVDSQGGVHKGRYEPEANLSVSTGRYAAHTGGGNTGSVGVAACGMAGFSSRSSVGKFPLTRKQLEAMFELTARLCKRYGLPVTSKTVMTHYEFGRQNPSTSSAGKIDIVFLPPFPEVGAGAVGDFIRQKVKWYLAKISA